MDKFKLLDEKIDLISKYLLDTDSKFMHDIYKHDAHHKELTKQINKLYTGIVSTINLCEKTIEERLEEQILIDNYSNEQYKAEKLLINTLLTDEDIESRVTVKKQYYRSMDMCSYCDERITHGYEIYTLASETMKLSTLSIHEIIEHDIYPNKREMIKLTNFLHNLNN